MRALFLTLSIVTACLRAAGAETFTFDVDAERVPPAIVRSDDKLEITWPDWLDGRQAQLEQADSVEGPWRIVANRAPYQADSTRNARQYFRVRARPVTLHIPASYDPQTPMPLVLLLHFYSGPEQRGNLSAGQSQEERLGFLPLSESHGFLYAFPDGLLDAAAWQFWAANEDVADFGGMGVDDHDFLRRVIAAIQSEYNVDPKRVYLIGHFGGAIMAYEFAARHSELVAAAVALAPPVTPNALQTPPSEPVHILQINGTADTLVPFEGGSTPFNAGLGPQMLDYAAVREVLETWAQFNGCSNWVSDPQRTLDLVGEISGVDTAVSRYATYPPGGDIELWSVQGGNNFFHNATDEFRDKVIEWLLQHPKP